jgi:ribosomal protein S18 acetylase RimI-like enzyme
MDTVIAPGMQEDFLGIDAFVADAISDAFYRPDLTDAQLAENAWIVEIASRSCLGAIGNSARVVLVAKDGDTLAGFVIADRSDPAIPEIDSLIVAKSHRGTGVAAALMNAAMDWIGPDVPIKLGVIHFNARAIAFYKKFGFVDTGEIVGRHKIPRKLFIRPAGGDRR